MASCSQVNSFLQAHVDGELDPSEDQVLATHLDECAVCRAEIAAMEAFQKDLIQSCGMHRQQGTLSERVLAHLPEMDPALHYGSHPTDPRMTPTRYRFRLGLPLAACAALALVAGVLLAAFYPADTPAPVEGAIGMVVFCDGPGAVQRNSENEEFAPVSLESLVAPGAVLETLEGSRLAVSLARGSSLKMNSQTQAVVNDSRNVHVNRGQAYFDVGRDREHFFVTTPTGEVLVYGTSFLVEVEENVTTVTVVEGDVLVSTPEGRSALSGGKRSVLREGSAPTAPEDATGGLALAWVLSMNPDPQALALFAQTIANAEIPARAVPAEAVFAVRNIGDREIEGIMLTWSSDGTSSGHCGYFVHVSDSSDNLLFLDTVDGSVFDNARSSSLLLEPSSGPISGVDLVHIRLIPDFESGTLESTVQVNAVVR